MVDESRVQRLESRVEALSRRLEVVEGPGAACGGARRSRPARRRRSPPLLGPRRRGRWPSAAAPEPVRRPAPTKQRSVQDLLGAASFEDLLGGRVLAWVGGLAVLIGIAFLFAVAVSSGWIGEGARTLIAGTGSAALLALGIWLHEQRGRTDAALASVATGVAALFVTITVGSQVYDVLPAPVALVLALGVGALATALAVRWEAQGIAALGIVGALVSPVLAGGEPEAGTMGILLVAAGSAVGVLLHQRWEWLSYAVFAITLPQVAAFLGDSEQSVATTLAVLIGFGLVERRRRGRPRAACGGRWPAHLLGVPAEPQRAGARLRRLRRPGGHRPSHRRHRVAVGPWCRAYRDRPGSRAVQPRGRRFRPPVPRARRGGCRRRVRAHRRRPGPGDRVRGRGRAPRRADQARRDAGATPAARRARRGRARGPLPGAGARPGCAAVAALR